MLGPVFQRPLDHGADIVITSLSKYVGGHGDLVGGVAVLKTESEADYLKFCFMCELGSSMDPHTAFLLSRSVKTIDSRMQVHQKHLLELNTFLKAHPAVERIFEVEHIEGQTIGQGGVTSFCLKEGFGATRKLLRNLKTMKICVSYGAVDYHVESPILMSHRSYLAYPQSKEFQALAPIIRVSTGLTPLQPVLDELDIRLRQLC